MNDDEVVQDIPATIQSFNVTTHVTEIEREDPEQEILIIARVNDDNGDVAAVNVDFSGVGRFLLDREGVSNKFSFRYDVPEVAGLRLLQGSSFYLYIYDNEGFVTRSERGSISRVLDQELPLVSPLNRAVVGLQPVLSWEKYPIFIEVEQTYQVTVGISNTTTIVYQSTKTQVSEVMRDTVNAQLVAGQDYFWRVTMEDALGNTHTSKNGSFVATDTLNIGGFPYRYRELP
jgi:hypothetical protein